MLDLEDDAGSATCSAADLAALFVSKKKNFVPFVDVVSLLRQCFPGQITIHATRLALIHQYAFHHSTLTVNTSLVFPQME
jgi:hypothetical protein